MKNIKNILHYGLQRSGTNILETHLKQNFKLEILNNNLDRKDTLHKHFRLYNEKQYIPESQFYNDVTYNSFKEYESSFGLTKKVDGIIVISKDPYSWYISYLNWAKKCNWPKVDYHYIEEYNRFYVNWLTFSKEDDRIIFIKYIDLITNAKHVLTTIKNKYQLPLKLTKQIFGIYNQIEKVSESKNFTTSDLKYYTEKEYLKTLSLEDMEAINSKINQSLLQELGYEYEKNIQ